jgi:DNA-binding NtrC family response regulator
VLIVEDDPIQREVLASTMSAANLDVIQCSSVAAAELIVGAIGAELAVVITDVWLSDQPTGAELARFAANRHPLLRLVVISEDEDFALPRGARFVRKPYRPADVLSAAASRIG